MSQPPATDDRRLSRTQQWIVWSTLAVVLVLAIGLNIAGTPERLSQMAQPYLEGQEMIAGQLLLAEQDALAELGISSHNWASYLLGLSWLLSAICLVLGGLIFYLRKDSWMAAVAVAFAVLVSLATTQGAMTLGGEHESLVLLVNVVRSLTLLAILLLFYQFPTGRFVPCWTRWVVGVFVVQQVVWLVVWSVSGSPSDWNASLDAVFGMLVIVGGLLAQRYRYTRVSTAEERQQTKWTVTVLGINTAIFLLSVLTTQFTHQLFASELLNVAWKLLLYHSYAFATLMIPVTLVAAILRYRLWDVDIFINRGLVYGSMTAILGLIFAACILVFMQIALQISDDRHLLLALGIAGLAVGALFHPLRQRLQRLVDRRIYGIAIAYDPQADPNSLGGPRNEGFEVSRSHKRMNHYTCGELLRREALVDVYSAVDTVAEERVDVLFIDLDSRAPGAGVHERFSQLAQNVSTVRHRGVVPVLDHGIFEGTPYLVTPPRRDKDLGMRLDAVVRMPQEEVMEVVQDLADALDAIHARGLFHLNLCPENVLLTRPTRDHSGNRARLAGLGVATCLTQLHGGPGPAHGNVDYIAPELVRGDEHIDHRADIYALGMLAYRLLTGRTAFPKSTAAARLIAHLHEPPPDPAELVPGLSPAIGQSIRRALAKRPGDRFDSAGEMLRAMRGSRAHAI